jgi:predicted Zn-ribbon and HTH transcriptional regulator
MLSALLVKGAGESRAIVPLDVLALQVILRKLREVKGSSSIMHFMLELVLAECTKCGSEARTTEIEHSSAKCLSRQTVRMEPNEELEG